ncbi:MULTISPECIES: efflux RND transporter periplasmic adaptor subunit [Pseudomonadaceae]|uniref:RND family efflux transporter, MFP subunit n=1 Tax=Pseudomonas straminea TaxID=47882 RepID=A0A1I1S9H8_PSEOC|nr:MULTISPECIES: efflux RND transporter periplasmic adaptor subunit [Pseudomonas]TWE06698.1 RND family efflux transporter MFP subunit [Pseudomonas sp. AG1028]SFD43096.1 RND family efflux transporter, MFP subunit [Pseudomonas straminea]
MAPSRILPLVMCIVLVGVGLAWWLRPSPTAVAQAPAAVPVVVHEVVPANVPVLLRTLGRVRAQSSVEIRAQVDATLVELPVAEGQQVRKGQLLARLDDRSLRAALQQAQAERDVTRAELDIARIDLQRYQNLVRERASPAQTLDQQKALVARLQATLATRDAAVNAARVQLSYTRIESPIEGRLGIRNVDVGSLLRSNDSASLFSVVQIDPIDVEATLPQRRLPELQRLLGAVQETPVQAFAEDGGALLGTGTLALIDNRVALDTGTLRFKARFANAQQQLWPDQSVVVTLQTGLLEQALAVPLEALRQRTEGTFVWRVEGEQVQPVAVKVLHEDEQRAVVSGLAAGDRIVTDGQSRLRPGVTVRRVEPVSVGGNQP